MNKTKSTQFTRRDFLRRAAAASGALAFPLIVPARLTRADAPSNRACGSGILVAGGLPHVHDMPGVVKADLADVVAVCDLDSKRATAGKATVEQLHRDNNLRVPENHGLRDYHELLARKDIDAVVISLPDHWHAEMALAATLAGKDIYLQKPFTMTHAEGIVVRDAVVRSGRIFQIGSQQRSWGPNYQFRKACEFVRNRRVAQLQRVEIGLPVDPTAPDDREQRIPTNLNYERLAGPDRACLLHRATRAFADRT